VSIKATNSSLSLESENNDSQKLSG